MTSDSNKQAKVTGKIPVVVIFAPTASGKTALTGDLFSPSGSHFILNAEVISADSMQVYKYMDIGTAKAEPEFCEKIPHHLINLVTPDIQFTVADFIKLADEKCEEIYNKGKVPVVVGGTGFYIRNFLYGLPETPESDEKLRNQLKERIEIVGNEVLYKELQSVDPESAMKIHVNDAYRIVRALEVFYTTGKKRSDFVVEKSLRDKFNFLFIVLQPPRDLLYERIRNRVDIMFEQGLVKEFNSLVEKGYSKDTPGMKAIGYSEFFEYEDLETVKERIKHDSCKYAKKQYTYINDIPGSVIVEFTASDSDIKKVADIITDFVQN